MKAKGLIILSLLLSVTVIGCSSMAERLKSKNPSVYNEIVGKWNVLSANNPSEIKASFVLKENGVVDDPDGWIIQSSMRSNYKNFQWDCNERGYVDTYVSDEDSFKSYSGGFEYIINDKNINRINSSLIPYRSKIGFISIGCVEWEREDYIVVREKDTSEIINVIKNINSAKNSEWERIDKTSILAIIDFVNKTEQENIKKTAIDSLHNLLDEKIKTYISNKYKPYASLVDKDIIFEDGTRVCKFYEFFKLAVCGINKNSGEKITMSIESNDLYPNGVTITTSIDNRTVTAILKPYKDNVVVMGMDLNGDSRGWQYSFSIIAQAWNQYPEISNIDVDLLEKL